MTPRDLIRLLSIVLELCCVGLGAYAEGPTLIAGSASEVAATTSPLTPAPFVVSSCLTYDRYGRVLSAQNPDGTTSYTVYGKQGKPTSVVNALLQATTFDYNTAGQLLRTTYADGTHEDSTYDKEGRALTRTDRLGRVTTYTYDAVGRLTSVLAPDGSSTWTAYDAAGRVSSTTDAAGAVTTFGYDVVNRRTSVTNALAQTTTFAFDAVGNQTSVTDALNRVTSFAYDALDRRTLVTLPDAIKGATPSYIRWCGTFARRLRLSPSSSAYLRQAPSVLTSTFNSYILI